MNLVTLAIIKPDAVRNGHVGEILHLAAHVGLQPIAIQMGTLDDNCWAAFYEEHVGREFFAELCTFMASGPCVFVALEGPDAINEWRKLMGPTNPKEAPASTLRGRFGTGGPANAVHGSATQDDAERELMLVHELLKSIEPSNPISQHG